MGDLSLHRLYSESTSQLICTGVSAFVLERRRQPRSTRTDPLIPYTTLCRPAEADHRVGHGKAEALAGLGQAALIVGSALFLVVEAIDRLSDPQPVQHGIAGIAVMGLSIALTAALVLYQRRVVQRTGSLAVTADRLHYVGDLLTNAAVIAALLIGTPDNLAWFDPACALALAAENGRAHVCTPVTNAQLARRL